QANSSVFLITLDTGHAVLARAAADGSFSGSIFAPAGTSIQVKADASGFNYGQVFNHGVNSATGSLPAVPATILRIPDPPDTGSGVPFAGAGVVNPGAPVGSSTLPAWVAEGTVNRQSFNAGDTLRAQGTLRVASPALAMAGSMQAHARLTLERLSAPDGS